MLIPGAFEQLKERDKVGAFFLRSDMSIAPSGNGILSGLSCGVKDVFDIAGHRTGFGNPDWLETHAPATENAEAVRRISAAGAAVIGKTHTDELAFSINGINHHYGAPLNSAAPERIVGGSSCGSAAAVAAGLCDFALGTDTGGSVRLPASFCGLFGIRPTHDAVSKEGVCPLSPQFDVAGWFARDADVLHRVGQVLLPNDTFGKKISSRKLASDAWSLLPSSEQDGAIRLALKATAGIGSSSELVIAPSGFDQWFEAFRILEFEEIWRVLGPWIERMKPHIGPGIAERLEIASRIKPEEVNHAASVRDAASDYIQSLLADGSVLVVPTVPGAAPRRDEAKDVLEDYRMKSMRLLCMSGLTGCPQVTMPWLTSEGAPLGVSLIGPRGSDRQLLDIVLSLSASVKV